MSKYILVGGSPFRGYNGTTTYTSLYEVGRYDTKEDADAACIENYEKCGGLLLIVPVATSVETPLDSFVYKGFNVDIYQQPNDTYVWIAKSRTSTQNCASGEQMYGQALEGAMKWCDVNGNG